MKTALHGSERERGGVLLLVVVILATAIAGLAGITSGRVVQLSRDQAAIEAESRALNSAYAQIHLAMNVVNSSAYDAENHNLELRDALAGVHGGTVAGEDGVTVDQNPADPIDQFGRRKTPGGEPSGYALSAKGGTTLTDAHNSWMNDPVDVEHGLIRGTNVRVYHARDYLKRLQKLKGEDVVDVDPTGLSDSYFILEAAGRVGNTIRLVSALVRENEPFSSFVFFQNRGTLGVSGAPRGLIHSNKKVAFYFPNGSYVDSVTAVDGFDYVAGATAANTELRDANPKGSRIDLEKVDFAELKGKADLFVGQDGLDAEIQLVSSGQVRIDEYTPPRFEMVTRSFTWNRWVGYHFEPYTATEQRQVGEREVAYEEQIVDYYETEDYFVLEEVQVGERQETRYRDVTVQTGTRTVTKTREEPVYETRTVTRTRQVRTWVPYDQDGASGGTSVGGGGAGGELGEWVWVDETYETTELVQVGTTTVAYQETEPVYETRQEAYQVTVPVYESKLALRQRQVPVYKTVTRYRMEPIYESVAVEQQRRVDDYEPVTFTWQEEQFFEPVHKRRTDVELEKDKGGTIFIDGRITKLQGDLNGRLTLVGNEKVRVTGTIRYLDGNAQTAMKNGGDVTRPYERNSSYTGNSTLGVIARGDILFTAGLPEASEINGSLMTVNGRVGIDGFVADKKGELHEDSRSARKKHLTKAQREVERAYDRVARYATRRFTKDSLRRVGGLISNNRVMETYITTDADGKSTVAAGFKRGTMRYDINLLFSPPPNFVEVPRPVLTYFVPILLVHGNDA